MAGRARSVEIDAERLEAWTRSLPQGELAEPPPLRLPRGGDDETRCAFVLQLDAVNFGSGWFPALRKRPGLSGYRSIEAALVEHFERSGGWTAERLAGVEARDCAALFGQGDAVPELMRLFAASWRALGRRVVERHAGGFARMVDSARGSAAALVRELLCMDLYRDVHLHDGEPVAFLKRAQITVADLDTPRPGGFGPLRELTIFADNLVPHVLRLDGVLRFEPGLVERIEAGECLEPGSAEEVEIRACAVTAIERVVRSLDGRSCAREFDAWLWQRGGGPRYKARPRHRARCTDY